MLTTQQKQKLQQILQERLNQINIHLRENDHFGNEWAHAQQSVGELSNYDNHPADTGTELFEREKDIALNDHIEQEKKEIANALQKMQDGSYGKCEICHKPIPYERLETIPTTLRCIEHTEERKLSNDRPIEETVRSTPFHSFNKEDQTNFFDGEDTFQILQHYGTSETPSDFSDNAIVDYNDMTIDEDELTDGVELFEQFVGSDLDGSGHHVYPNAAHERYESMLDENNERLNDLAESIIDENPK
ncbi:TraR/DksA C4-type zinc finger protein [Bacillus solimangrovi]|uniref:Zinc finger DksA/TraR C4-type domain-containing protein n=1 Tax=Bacillus solimangrovi TaxID=1305675 RepID=A0A1E5LGD7_9BACI|nr:TraR/DksA C4-type zinc finger protein [Bacillus solimangrovi]OEH93140.1 hypothetical protein BFG57_13430 [Bacillus solimangrovi]